MTFTLQKKATIFLRHFHGEASLRHQRSSEQVEQQERARVAGFVARFRAYAQSLTFCTVFMG